MENKAESTKKGGLYAKVNMSVRSANIMVGTLAALLVIVSVFIVSITALPLSLIPTAARI